jgi:two-component system KDP operon response regulator KdpE
VIARVREWSGVPIIVLSVRAAEDEKVAALDRGADDYVTKPFGIHELLARVRASLRARRQDGAPPSTVKAGELTIDLPRRRVHVAGSEIELSRKEFAILRLVAQHAGRIVTHQHLLREVWSPSHEHETHYLRIYIGICAKSSATTTQTHATSATSRASAIGCSSQRFDQRLVAARLPYRSRHTPRAS